MIWKTEKKKTEKKNKENIYSFCEMPLVLLMHDFLLDLLCTNAQHGSCASDGVDHATLLLCTRIPLLICLSFVDSLLPLCSDCIICAFKHSSANTFDSAGLTCVLSLVLFFAGLIYIKINALLLCPKR